MSQAPRARTMTHGMVRGAWIDHRGSDARPIELQGLAVRIRMRCGREHDIAAEFSDPEADMVWSHNGGQGDIIAFKVLG